MFERVALIGIGLIGSSISLAIRKRGLAQYVVGHTKSSESTRLALELGLADEMFPSPEEAVENADLVILCTPVGTFEDIARKIGPRLKPGSTITDVGSVKGFVIEKVTRYIPEGVYFIPSHPLAGTELSGPTAGFAELFENRWCLMTPLNGTNPEKIKVLCNFWQALGSKVELMDPDHHDTVLAVTSHVPHLIAYTMVGTADHLHRISNSEVIQYSAAGFRDFTRIAASDPTMWRDVFLTNKEATLDILGRFTEELFSLQRLIRTGNGQELFDYFQKTRIIRQGIIEAGQDTSSPDFGRTKNKPNKAQERRKETRQKPDSID